jgi:hypothetical protein
MESILVHPESAEQMKTVKAVLKALKVQFEQQPEILPAHVVQGIERSLKQAENGQTISLEDFKARHFSKK